MSYKYGHPATGYNGICIWLQGFEAVRTMETNKKFQYINQTIEDFIKYNSEHVSRTKDGKLNIYKASNLIQTRWDKFTKWYKAKEALKGGSNDN